jgi:hypothetical protein
MRNRTNKIIVMLILILIIVSGLLIKGMSKKNKSTSRQNITDNKVDDLYYQSKTC